MLTHGEIGSPCLDTLDQIIGRSLSMLKWFGVPGQSMVWSHYNTVNILENSHNKPSIAHSQWWEIASHNSLTMGRYRIPHSKVHGANMGPTWDLLAPDGSHVGPMNLAIRDVFCEIKAWSMFSLQHWVQYPARTDLSISRPDCNMVKA